ANVRSSLLASPAATCIAVALPGLIQSRNWAYISRLARDCYSHAILPQPPNDRPSHAACTADTLGNPVNRSPHFPIIRLIEAAIEQLPDISPLRTLGGRRQAAASYQRTPSRPLNSTIASRRTRMAVREIAGNQAHSGQNVRK